MFTKVLWTLIVVGIFDVATTAENMLCYRCNSNSPGCGDGVNWLFHSGHRCPEYTDPCVKVVERKGSEVMITRECLSVLKGIRTDIPADQYEGCRPAAKDHRLGHYVFNNITELDIRRNYYDEVSWCFCFFDNWCNSASGMKISGLLIGLVAVIRYIAA